MNKLSVLAGGCLLWLAHTISVNKEISRYACGNCMCIEQKHTDYEAGHWPIHLYIIRWRIIVEYLGWIWTGGQWYYLSNCLPVVNYLDERGQDGEHIDYAIAPLEGAICLLTFFLLWDVASPDPHQWGYLSSSSLLSPLSLPLCLAPPLCCLFYLSLYACLSLLC